LLSQFRQIMLHAAISSPANPTTLMCLCAVKLPANVAAGLALEPIRVYTDDLDGAQATAAAAAAPGSASSKLQLAGATAGSSSSSAVGGFDWQSLWGCDSSSDAALEAPSAGSFLLGALLSGFMSVSAPVL
jgi:hypothetical protein